MDKSQWKNCIKWVLLTEAVGLLAGLLTRNGVALYQQYAEKSQLTPPGWVFPVVWTVLYALMGISVCMIARPEAHSSRCVNLFVFQLILNFFWPLLFFNAQAYGFALIWLAALWAAVLFMILCFYRIKPLAAWLQVPYLLWLTFAGYLNASAWYLNQ